MERRARANRADLLRVHHARHHGLHGRPRRLDVAILEVGLGGRLDAVNIVDADCAIITSIDLDHMEFLGPDRESIGFEKAGILRAGRPAIVSDPMPPQSVIDARRGHRRRPVALGPRLQFSGDKQQWGWAGRGRRYSGLAYPALRGANQLINAAGVLAALEALRAAAAGHGAGGAQRAGDGRAAGPLPDRSRRSRRWCWTWRTTRMRWRRWRKTSTPWVSTRPRMPCSALMADKDLAPMLARIGPLIDRWYFTDLPTPRAAAAADLLARWQAQNTRADASASAHADAHGGARRRPSTAADPADRIVVFGSFFTVGGVLEHGTPRLQARHLLPDT